MIRKLFLFAGIVLATHTRAQQVRPATSAEIYHEIAQLKNLTNVLYLAAHPDDENTRLLSWLVNHKHIPTAYLSLTRGDGGQNILGSEQGAALGLIRTYELLEARKIDGAEQFFTRAVDFGFSKSPEETFKHWNEYLLTNDVVRIIRMYRPDVVICRFPPDSRAGHGQHSASAILAEKAFKLAGDKLQYTEHFQNYAAWQPKRLLWNTYNFGRANTTSENQFKINVGHYSPNIGMGYGELAGISRSIHRSQGAGTPSTPGVQKEYFSLVAGDTMTNTLFDGIDITWNRVGKPEIGEEIERILDAYNFNKPAESLPALLQLRKRIAVVKDNYWRKQKLKELDQAIVHATGFMAEATTTSPQTVAGAEVPYTLKVIARSSVGVSVTALNNSDKESLLHIPKLKKDSLYSISRTLNIPANQAITQPYWLINNYGEAQFSVPHDSLIGLPQTPNDLTINLKLKIGDENFEIAVPLSYKKLDPVRGDIVEQLRVVPDVSIEPFANLLITKPDGSLSSSVRLQAFKDVKNASLVFYGNNKEMLRITNLNLRANVDTTISFNITAAQSNKISKEEYFLTMELEAEGKTYDKTLRLIQYDHIPTLQYFTPPASKVIKNDWKAIAKKIGFVEGAGDYTVTLLRLAGMNVDILKDADLAQASRLKSYDAIITGVRAINTEKKMTYWMPVLLDYVKNGGTLVMQYNTLQDMQTTNISPYPLTLSRKRVTEENAKIEMLLPNHRLLNYPNKITEKDFQNWAQERSLYVPEQWDGKYQALFRMNDAGEEPLDGATLYAPYGKGHYVYTSLAFFRQLPAGNKGAVRMLMNMLSVGK
ncbi:MAG TPA: PIG-L family deacetylase [Flavipsychrobacter sp.]|nr:PIG-L family deacetylase [Flavipsychrobacter sp.]